MNDFETLSPAGIQRRQHILHLAQSAATKRRLKRRTGRGLSVACLLGVAGLTAWSLTQLQAPPVARPIPIAQIAPPSSMPEASVQYLATDPSITDRLSIKPSPPQWKEIGNEELLQDLADAGKPTGIVCMNGRTILLPH